MSELEMLPNKLQDKVTVFILLRHYNDYDQHGGYFAGVFLDEKRAIESVHHIGRENAEYSWYEVVEVSPNAIFKNEDENA